MKKLYFLNEEEKNRILNMHKDASKKQYLTENKSQVFEHKQSLLMEGPKPWWKRLSDFLSNFVSKPRDVNIGPKTRKSVKEIKEMFKGELNRLGLLNDTNFLTLVKTSSKTKKEVLTELEESLEKLNDQLLEKSLLKTTPSYKNNKDALATLDAAILKINIKIKNIEKQVDFLENVEGNIFFTEEKRISFGDIEAAFDRKSKNQTNSTDEELFKTLGEGEFKIEKFNDTDVDYVQLKTGDKTYYISKSTDGGVKKIDFDVETPYKKTKAKGIKNTALVRFCRGSYWNLILCFAKLPTIATIIIAIAESLGFHIVSEWKFEGVRNYFIKKSYTPSNMKEVVKDLKDVCNALKKDKVSYQMIADNPVGLTGDNPNFKNEYKNDIKNWAQLCGCQRVNFDKFFNDIVFNQEYETTKDFVNYAKGLVGEGKIRVMNKKLWDDIASKTFSLKTTTPGAGSMSLDLDINQLVKYAKCEKCVLDTIWPIIYDGKEVVLSNKNIVPMFILHPGGDKGTTAYAQGDKFVLFKDKAGYYYYNCKKVDGDQIIKTINDAQNTLLSYETIDFSSADGNEKWSTFQQEMNTKVANVRKMLES